MYRYRPPLHVNNFINPRACKFYIYLYLKPQPSQKS
jgi:hypothetical protein